jgi:peptidoglycan/LPS O-acetylase OafA/YrhL
MQRLVTAIRFMAVLIGLFLLLSAAAEVAGVLPESNGPVPFRERLTSALVPAVFGLVLLAPHRRFLNSPWFHALLAAHGLLAALAAFRTVQTVALVRTGELAPVAVLVAVIVAAVPLASAIALWVARHHATPPNNSSKPTPLRGAA